jgi:hypothetical protein
MPNDNTTTAVTELRPRAVPVNTARALLGNKSRSAIYLDIAAGRLHALKDGARTLITVASIDRYFESLPPAQLAPPYRGNAALPPRLRRVAGEHIDCAGAVPENAVALPGPGQSWIAVGGRESGQAVVNVRDTMEPEIRHYAGSHVPPCWQSELRANTEHYRPVTAVRSLLLLSPAIVATISSVLTMALA